MPGLLYYLPKLTVLGDVAGYGLGYAFEADRTPRGCTNGPDGNSGLMVADPDRVPRIGHYPKEQTWQRIPGNPVGAWVGRYTDQPVLPDDLQRIDTLPGHEVRLGDGRQWLVPVARGLCEQDGSMGWYHALPCRMAIDDSGVWTAGAVVDRYAPLWAIATRWWDAIAGADRETDAAAGQTTVRFDFQDKNNAAVRALAANYRLAAAEVSLLGLFEDGTAEEVLMALVDWPTLEEFKKKQETTEPVSTAAG